MALADDITSLLTRRGMLSGGDLQRVLDISAATLSRQVRAAESVLRIGRTRGARYAAYRRMAGLPSQLPVFRVDTKGEAHPVASLHLLALGQHWLEPATAPGTLFAGLPPVIADMAPQGFLGRRFAEVHADLVLPRRLQDWNDDYRLIATARRGDDCIGDLIVGEESLHRFLDTAPEPITQQDYPARARVAVTGGAGSFAGGEQPKFTAQVEGRWFIIKFTPGDGSPADARWRDLLACELLASEILNAQGISAVQAELVEVGPQWFLQIERFDRVGMRGRRGVLTAGPLDDELYGQRDSWPAFAERVSRDGLLVPEQVRRIRLLDAFGQLIGNGDRHFGNLSFFADGLLHAPALQLAPAYDMLPMAWAPDSGNVPVLELSVARPRANTLDVWPEALRFAGLFWRQVAEDERISREMRNAAAKMADNLK